MQGFLVAAPVLFCLTQAAPQSKFEYNPDEADKYVEANPYKYDPDNNDKPWSFNYDPAKDSNSFKYDPSSAVAYNYAYDPQKDKYKYTYDPSKQQSFDTSNLEDLLGSLQAISKSKLLGDTLKDCKALQDLPEAIEETNEAVASKRGEIESAFNGLTRARDGQQEPGDTVRQISSAIGAIEPLIPVVTRLFNFNNEGCKLDQSARKKRQTFDACADPTELSKDVFLGVADLLELTAELQTENPGRYNLDTNEIQEQAELIRDGAVSVIFFICLNLNLTMTDFYNKITFLSIFESLYYKYYFLGYTARHQLDSSS